MAPGGLKPQVSIPITTTVLTARKIAAWVALYDETLQDFPSFIGDVQGELSQLIADVENEQILNGDGTGNNLTGILTTGGILKRTFATGQSSLDVVEQSITDLRNGPAKASPDCVVMNPTDWSSIRRSKDSQGRYLVTPDPTSDAANTLGGTPVLVTTSAPVGTALVANLEMSTVAFIRTGLTVELTNNDADDFVHNLAKLRPKEGLMVRCDPPVRAGEGDAARGHLTDRTRPVIADPAPIIETGQRSVRHETGR